MVSHHRTWNDRREIVRDDQDRRHFLELLGGMVFRFKVRLHCFVLMENHYHLLLELSEANLSRAVQRLNVSYRDRAVDTQRMHHRLTVPPHVPAAVSLGKLPEDISERLKRTAKRRNLAPITYAAQILDRHLPPLEQLME